MTTTARRKYSLFPKRLAQCIDPLTKPLFKARGLAGSQLVVEWPQVVGAELSAYCWPEKLSFSPGKKTDGTLTIAVENGFALELQHMQPVILERVNVYYGYRAVTRLAITQRPPRAKAPAAAATTAPPLTSSQAENAVRGVSDPELKNALQSLAKTLSGQ